MPAIQPSDCRKCTIVGPPRVKSRSTLQITVTGLTFAKACNQPGIDATGTNAALANVNGNSQISPADCTVSGSLIVKPMNAATVQMATPNATATMTSKT